MMCTCGLWTQLGPEPSTASYLAFALVAFAAVFWRARDMQYRWPRASRPRSTNRAHGCYLYKSIDLGGLASNRALSQAFPRG